MRRLRFTPNKKLLTWGGVLGIFLVHLFQITPAIADLSESMRGFAWGGTFSDDSAYQGIGWVSLNNLSDGTGIDYGVQVPSRDGAVSGQAWSEHYGWISFEGADLSGCTPALAPAARSGSAITGGARILAIRDEGGNAGGFDGCISLSGAGYGLTVNGSASPYTLSGHAWSSDLGWIDFAGAQVILDSIATMSVVGCAIPIGSATCNAILTWEIRDAANPNVFNSSLNVGYSMQAVGNNVVQAMGYGNHTLEARNGGTVLQSTNVNIVCEGVGQWNATSGRCYDPRPNFNRPMVTISSLGTFDPATATYSYADIYFSTANNGGSATPVDATYTVEVTGYSTQSGTIASGLAPVPAGFNRTVRIPGPISLGSVPVKVSIDTPIASNGSVNEVTEGEADNTDTATLTIPPPDPGLTLMVDRERVRNNESTVLRWTVTTSYPGLTCQVNGPGVNLNPAPLNGNRATQPIFAKSEYVFSCVEGVTNTKWSKTVYVETTGTIEEI